MAAGWALCWEMWARQRWGVRVVAACLLLLLVMGRTLPSSVLHNIVPLMLIVLLFGMLVIIAGLCRGLDVKMDGAGSMLPPRLLVLPVSSRALVGWSMLGGAVPLGLIWPICVLTLFWPQGRWAPLIWPGLLVFNVVACLQALCWRPFGVPYVRMWVAGLGVPALIVGTVFLAEGVRLHERTLALLLAGMGLVAFKLAVAGIERARHDVGSGAGGDSLTGWRIKAPPSAVSGIGADRPFSSLEQAVFWREWRLFRWWLFLFYGMFLVFGTPYLQLTSQLLQDDHKVAALQLTGAVQAVGKGWLALAHMLLLPGVFCLSSCTGLGQINPEARDWTGFVLVRPVRTAIVVKTKLCLCGLAVLLGGALVLAIAAAWAFWSGNWFEMSDHLVAWSGSGPAAWLVLAGGVLALLTITWGQVAAGLWVGLTGSRWIEWVAVATVMFLVGGGLALTGIAAKDSDSLIIRLLKPVLPAIPACAIGLKTVLTIAVMRENLRRGLLSAGEVLLALGVWTGVAIALFAGLAWLMPTEIVSRANLASVVVLVLPIARIGLAPLALAWNRHR